MFCRAPVSENLVLKSDKTKISGRTAGQRGQTGVAERSVDEEEVLPLCRFCASSEWKNNGVECMKCGEFCLISCAREHSLFVALAVHAVNLDDFLCDTCIGEESVSSLAELLFPRSESVVLRHTSVLCFFPVSAVPSIWSWLTRTIAR
ncbi:hypothetical protein BLNAU_24820 [Blattamonas nauphoetae]|uniref:Zinc finger PHD-type domain-containing protein n=1 Tax=Blattamonas nauphoetae TaxID=2049346 RepID=A0ABQ9WQG4_9EUKA|nr:hypothetical protein BLNAU_24820 [Blattamonas nauphoetae]